MKTAAVAIILALVSTVAQSETCPPEDQISPCECEESEDDGTILVSCAGETLEMADLQRAMRSLVGKQDVEIMFDDLRLGTLPSNFFAGIGVKILDISHCELDALSEDDSKRPLQGLEESLEELIILGSLSEDRKPAKFRLDHLRNLREVDFSFNSIDELDNDWFGNGLPNLEYIYISNNFIEKLGHKAFANLSGLKQFSLDGNRFGYITRSMLPTSAPDLEHIELDNNALTDVPEDLFTNFPGLKDVSLRTNGISRLEEKTWGRIWQQLDVIRLEGNPIECDSHFTWLFNLRSTTSIFGRCNSPRDKAGQSLQEFINSRGQ